MHQDRRDGTVPMHRLYNSRIDQFFYTTFESEIAEFAQYGYSSEGWAFHVHPRPAPGAVAFTRLRHVGPSRVHVKIAVLDVRCDDTEDVAGADELYVTGVGIDEADQRKVVLTRPQSINDDQTRGFPPDQAMVFDGSVPRGRNVAVYLEAFDEDLAKDWSNRPDWIKKAEVTIGTAGVAAVVAALATNPIGWATIGGLLTSGLVVGGLVFGLGRDHDDKLGWHSSLVPASGPADEIVTWRSNRRDRTGFSSWTYAVRYRITRS